MNFEDMDGYNIDNSKLYTSVEYFQDDNDDAGADDAGADDAPTDDAAAEESVEAVALSSESNGNWSSAFADSIEDNTIAENYTVSINHNITIAETTDKITNNGKIIITNGNILKLYTDIDNNNSITIQDGATLFITTNVRLTNNNKIILQSGSHLVLDGVLINTNTTNLPAVSNNGQIYTTMNRDNNNIIYHYGDNPVTGEIMETIKQVLTDRRIQNLEDIRPKVKDSNTLIHLEHNLLKSIIEEDDEKITLYIHTRTSRNGQLKTRYEHISNGIESSNEADVVLGWQVNSDDTYYSAERKETHRLVAETLLASSTTFLNSYTANNLVGNLRAMGEVNEDSLLLQLVDNTANAIIKSHELSANLDTVTLNTARIKLFIQEYNNYINISEDVETPYADVLNEADFEATLKNNLYISKLNCHKTPTTTVTKDCMLSKLFFKLTEECNITVTNIQQLATILAKFVQNSLFTKTQYTNLEYVIAYSQTPIQQIERLLNVWNFVLNVSTSDLEWEQFMNEEDIDTAWYRLYNKNGNYSFEISYDIKDIYTNENKTTMALRNNKLLSEYMCLNNSASITCPKIVDTLKIIIENLGPLKTLSNEINELSKIIYKKNKQFLEENNIEIAPEQKPNIKSSSVDEDVLDKLIGVEEEITEVEEEELVSKSANLFDTVVDYLKATMSENLTYFILLIVVIILVVSYNRSI